jgi:hypothetical protein
MDAKTERALRKRLREDYGKGAYRITKAGEVHAYGVMPNTQDIDWFFVGWVGDVLRSYGL